MNKNDYAKLVADLQLLSTEMRESGDESEWRIPIVLAAYVREKYLGLRERIDWDALEGLK